jgi:hypothetical protein
VGKYTSRGNAITMTRKSFDKLILGRNRMIHDRMDRKLCEWITICERLAGRSNIRWKNDIKENFRIIKISNCTTFIEDRINWEEEEEEYRYFCQANQSWEHNDL